MKILSLLFAAILTALPSPDAHVKYWILQGPRLDAYAMATRDRAIRFFSSPSRIVLYPAVAAVPPPESWHVVFWRKFDSLADFRRAIETNAIGKNVVVVGYDPERWQMTPDDEQRDPIASTIAFANLAHAHGYRVIVMPAANLMQRLFPGRNKYDAFVAYGYAKAVAQYVDFYHIQAQGLQHAIDRGTPSYVSFVRDIAAQVRAANPSAIITAGISTNTPGDVVPTQAGDMAAAARAVSDLVQGYWINVVRDQGDTANDALRLLDDQ